MCSGSAVVRNPLPFPFHPLICNARIQWPPFGSIDFELNDGLFLQVHEKNSWEKSRHAVCQGDVHNSTGILDKLFRCRFLP